MASIMSFHPDPPPRIGRRGTANGSRNNKSGIVATAPVALKMRRCRVALTLAVAVGLIGLCGLPETARAGAFVFSDNEDLGLPDIVTHPTGYTGSGGDLVIRVGIDPGSAYASEMMVPLLNVISVFNDLSATTGNLFAGLGNEIPQNAFDFESVALHEMGHALGLAHPNLATESKVPQGQTDYAKSTRGANGVYDLHPGPDGVIGSADDLRGDDVNLLWFSRFDNDPFTLALTVDGTTYSRDLFDLPSGHSFAASANREVAELLGYADTEAVMKQGTYNDEVQRTLVADDVAMLHLAGAGLDETEGTADDYTFRLEYVGLTTAADIIIAFDSGETGFAVTSISGMFLNATHMTITGATLMYFNPGVNWFFNPVLLVDNVTPVIDGQIPDPLRTPKQTPLAITLDRLRVVDPDNTYPADFSLSVYDGEHYARDGNVITPEAGFSGTLRVPVTVSDGIAESDPFELAVVVYEVVYVEPAGGCGGKSPCYATLQAAIDHAVEMPAGAGMEIRAAAAVYAEAPAFDTGAEITLDGGWSTDFTARTAEFVTIAPGAGAVTFGGGPTVIQGVAVE